jgi:hypothetical protein
MKPRGMTPMTVDGTPLIVIVWPMMWGSDA